MIINFVIGILVCFIFTLYLYLSYADPKTKSFVSLIVFLTWFLNFINIVIIPCDLYINYQREINKTDYERDNLNIKTLWIILYWIIFLNSWFIIPIVLDYEKAGDFTIKNKLKRAIKTNLFFYLLLVIIGIVFISYLIIKKNLNWNNLGIFLIALSNAWGIFVVILILGYGLVALPKKLWKLSDYNLQMQFLEWKASDTKENLDEHISELSILKIKIKYFKLLPDNNIDSQMILDEVCLELDKIPNYPNFILEDQLKKNTKHFNIEDIVKINQNEILLEWQFLKEITKQVYDDNSIGINKMFFLRVRPKLLIILSLFCSTLSFIVVFSEITLFLDIKLSLFGFFISLTRNNIYAINLFCIIPLIYMFVSALFGLFSFKFSGYYGMYKNKKTNSISLLFVANFMCRIGFALCVNYLQILKLNIKTSLDEVLGNINLVPIFGSSFPLFYPFVLVFLCLFNLFNLSGKLLSFLGFTTFETKDEFNKEKLLDGINIIEDLQSNKTDLFNIQENNYDYENKTSDMSKNLLKGNNEEDFKKIRNSSL